MKKRANWTLTDILYWSFYIPMTAVVISTLFIVPNSILNLKIDTQNIESDILAQRVFYDVSYTDPITGRIYPGILSGSLDLTSFNKSNENYELAFKISIDGKTVIYNPDFFETARPLAPIRYGIKIDEWKLKDIDNNPKIVIIEQVFNKK